MRALSVTPAAYDFDAAQAWSAETLHLPLRPNASAPWMRICEQLDSRGIRVVLTGEGGDDWLNGSNAHWPDLLLQGRWATLLQEGWAATATETPVRRLRTIASGALRPLFSAYRRQQLYRRDMIFNLDVPPWIRPEWAARIQLQERWRAASLPLHLPRHAQQSRYGISMPNMRHLYFDNIIDYADRAGVEMRHPFHDLRLTNFLMGAAGAMLRRGDQRRYLLREAMRGTLPEPIRTRNSKAEFSRPIYVAIEQRLKDRPLKDWRGVQAGWLDETALAAQYSLLQQWYQDPAQPYAPAAALRAVWWALSLDLWLEHAARC